MNEEKRKLIAERIVPLMEKLPPERQERILGWVQGAVDQKEYDEAMAQEVRREVAS